MYLKQSTAVDILIGPFVDKTDGATAETGESPSVKLSKNGQTLGAKNDATTPVSDADGYYNCELDATDTNTVGTLVLTIVASANALPVRHEFQVVEENVYDTWYAASADAGTLLDDVPSTSEFNARTLVAASYFDPAADAVATVTTLTNKTGFSLSSTGLDAVLKTATGMVAIASAVWDRVLTGATHNIPTSAGRRLRQVDAAFEVHSGTAQAGAATTITLDTGASASNDIYRGDRIIIVGGTGIQEHGICISYNGTTKVATMAETWIITPDATSEFEVVPASVDIETWQHNVVTGDGDWASLDTNVDAIKVVTDQFVAAQTEPSGVPASNETPLEKLGFLFKSLRNAVTVTATKKQYFDDGGSAGWEKDLSDDGTTYTETKGNAP